MTQSAPDLPPSLDDLIESPEGPLAQFLCFSVYSTGLAFNRLYKPLLDRLGLTYLQYLALIALARRDDQTVKELGEALFLESNTLTPLLKRLEASGLLTRRRDTADERVVRLALTEQGRDVLREARCVPGEVLEATGMAVEELIALNNQLKALRGNLQTGGLEQLAGR